MARPQPEGDGHAEAARHAIAVGSAAMAAGAQSNALRWFERANRLVPNDAVPRHLLAAALANIDPARALHVLNELIAEAPDDREAQVARIALLHRCENDGAADALDTLLSNFSLPPGRAFASLASAIAQRAGCAGWAGASGGGTVFCQGARLSLSFDGTPPFRAAAAPGQHELPASWRRAAALHVVSAAGRVLGAQIDLAALRHTVGFVAYTPGRGLHGWAVAPRDPDAVPELDVFAGAARRPFMTVAASDSSLVPETCHAPPASRGFSVLEADLPDAARWHMRTRCGTDLAGSPVRNPGWARAGRRIPRRREIDIIIPLFRGAVQAAACVQSVCAGLPPGARIVAVDDASPDAALRQWASDEAAAGRIILLRHDRNRGFPAAINTGLRHAGGRDVVLLNSDTLVPPGAIERLAEAAYATRDTGTATPMTNDGSLTTLGTPGERTAMPSAARLLAIDADLRQANTGLSIEIPTCVGFCTFIRHDCLAGTGKLREDVFAQGYGEENDFSRRAAQRGWRHVAACDVFVAHQGGTSFGAMRQALMARNLALVEALHPGYTALIEDFAARDPLAPARAAYDARRWAADRRESAIVLVTHADGGGVERHVAGRVAAICASGARAIVVRPRGGYAVSDGIEQTHPNLVFVTVTALADFLRAGRPARVELHHIAAHAPGIARLAGLLRTPFDIIVHDYAAVCPRVTLCGPTQYCGEPADIRDCEDCVADHGARVEFAGSVAGLRASQAALFGAAARVVVATPGTAHRLRRYMPQLRATVCAWEDDSVLPAVAPLRAGTRLHVGVAGAIGVDKGYGVLLACARDAARRGLNLHFTVVGHTIGDERLLETGHVFVTGKYSEGEAPDLLRGTGADIGFVPSVWPETWCYALTALWQAGLHVAAFDIGAPAERIRARGARAGTLLPLGLPAAEVNDRLLALAARPAMAAHG
jgi:GT2 family glycosyltransferase/glycosyltransferase involved in cell wall biosynthesis